MRDREISKRQAFLIWLSSVIGMVLIAGLSSVIGMVLIAGWCVLLHWLGVW